MARAEKLIDEAHKRAQQSIEKGQRVEGESPKSFDIDTVETPPAEDIDLIQADSASLLKLPGRG